MSEYIWPITLLVLWLVVFAAVVASKILAAIKHSTNCAFAATEGIVDHMTQEHIRMSRKLEVWHEDSMAVANANAERLSETFLAAEDERYAHAIAHSKERIEAANIAASKSTNERLADLNESKVKADAAGASGKTQVRPSKASESRKRENEGSVPQRHQTRSTSRA